LCDSPLFKVFFVPLMWAVYTLYARAHSIIH
jgi:hypothetical protein